MRLQDASHVPGHPPRWGEGEGGWRGQVHSGPRRGEREGRGGEGRGGGEWVIVSVDYKGHKVALLPETVKEAIESIDWKNELQ